MTAQTTPRLGLMLPAVSDSFAIADFDTTMNTLDNHPGIQSVSNYASLPPGLTSAQHGMCYLQTDNGALWMWNKPGAPAGSWRRINTYGMLGSAWQGADVATTATSTNTGAVLVTCTFIATGGRRVLCHFSHPNITNSGSYGFSETALFVDGTSQEAGINYASSSSYKAASHRILIDLGTPAAGTSHTVVAKVCSLGQWGAGTSTSHGTGKIFIWEV